jgi:hypothetical protein
MEPIEEGPMEPIEPIEPVEEGPMEEAEPEMDPRMAAMYHHHMQQQALMNEYHQPALTYDEPEPERPMIYGRVEEVEPEPEQKAEPEPEPVQTVEEAPQSNGFTSRLRSFKFW